MIQLAEKIYKLYSEYQDFDTVVKQKNRAISDKQSSVKEILKDKALHEVEDVLIHVYVDTVLYNKDLQLLFFKLFSNIETYLEFSKEPLSEDIMNFYNSMKQWAPKRIFMLEKGDLVETETGTLDKARKDFINSDFFKGLLQQTKPNV